MKVFWFVNIVMPAVRKELGQDATGSGWWLSSLAECIRRDSDLSLIIAHCSSEFDKYSEFDIDGVLYILIPAKTSELIGHNSSVKVKELVEIVNRHKPDIIGVNGTEYIYGQVSDYLDVPVVVTIQGFVSEVEKRLFGSCGLLGYIFRQTNSLKDLKGLIKVFWSLWCYRKRSLSEYEILKCNKYFMGRTEWDKNIVESKAVNLIKYYECWEILRPIFYEVNWKPAEEKIILFTLGGNPYKGADEIVRAFAEVNKKLPKSKLMIAGNISNEGWGKYVRKLIYKLRISEKIIFCGYVSDSKLAELLQNASVYVHPSYVDNSPNSLAEAMCVGTPCVASNTCGIPSLLSNNETGLLYELGNIQDLAKKIELLLADIEFASVLGGNAKKTSRERHAPEKVAGELLFAYKDILKG